MTKGEHEREAQAIRKFWDNIEPGRVDKILIGSNQAPGEIARQVEALARKITRLIPEELSPEDLNRRARCILANTMEILHPDDFTVNTDGNFLYAKTKKQRKQIKMIPYIQKYIDEQKQFDPNFDLTAEDLIKQGFTKAGAVRQKFPYAHLIRKALKDMEATAGGTRELPIPITVPAIENSLFPIDKLNGVAWNHHTAETGTGLIFDIDTTSLKDKKKGLDAIIYFGINFDQLEPSMQASLTQYDRIVYNAVSSLYNADYKAMTVSMIWQMMGHEGRPSSDQIQKINDSLNKMQFTKISIDNSKEVAVNKGYPLVRYEGMLLEFRRVTVTVKNKLTDMAISVLAEPPLFTFAKKRRQLTTIPLNVISAPVNMSDINIAITNYLLTRIATLKARKDQTPVILYQTIFEKCSIEGRQNQLNAKKTIARLLNSYREKNYIIDFKEMDSGVTITI